MKQRALSVLVVLLFFSCSMQRKVSHVDVREPAATRPSSQTSALRDRLLEGLSISAACPADLHSALPPLAVERVKLLTCPERLQTDFEAARNALSLDESARLEDLVENQCRNAIDMASEGSLEQILQSMDPTLSRLPSRDTSSSASYSDAQLKLRFALRDSLLETKRVNAPLEQWMRANGAFVIADEPLQFLDQLASRGNCRIKSEEVDFSYRTIRSLEELAKMEPEGDPQRQRIEKLLHGFYQVVDQRIREFFQP